jgi:hypothetical protein
MGDDVMLSNVVGFDVKAFDPTATVAADQPMGDDPTEALAPGDPAYSTSNRIGLGAYVDLNYTRNRNARLSFFSGPPAFHDADDDGAWDADERLLSGLAPNQATYDTWTLHYEHDGVNQDRQYDGVDGVVDLSNNGVDDDGKNGIDDAGEEQMELVDEGADGVDNDGRLGVDDVGERETSPPYPVPLRGLQVRIRMLEPDSRQVRQVTVISDFTPE